jgi:tight adherence protein B
MDDFELIQLVVGLLAALTFAGIVFAIAYPYLSGDKQGERRLQAVTDARGKRTSRRGQSAADIVNNNRRKQVSDTLKDLETRQAKKDKVTLRQKLAQAGLDATPQAFWIASAICGIAIGFVFLISFPGATMLAAAGVAFAGGLGVPRWVLNFMIKRRESKFVAEFANAIDVIVRGVKSGLPLNECLGIIARESPEPLSSEFKEVVEQQRVGVPLGEALERMTQRVPTPETRFFAIVIAIQQQAGGNLSEALGNLSGVLRDRKRMQMKVKALSAEAKASAGVLASLPFIVATLVYLSSPKYIMFLFQTKSGNFMLGVGAVWMTMGVLVMRKMINFKY